MNDLRERLARALHRADVEPRRFDPHWNVHKWDELTDEAREYWRRLADALTAERERADRAEAERDALRAEMAAVASVAHDGGLVNLDSFSALIVVRRLTVNHWIAKGSIAEATQRVRVAIDARRAGE